MAQVRASLKTPLRRNASNHANTALWRSVRLLALARVCATPRSHRPGAGYIGQRGNASVQARQPPRRNVMRLCVALGRSPACALRRRLCKPAGPVALRAPSAHMCRSARRNALACGIRPATHQGWLEELAGQRLRLTLSGSSTAGSSPELPCGSGGSAACF